MIILGTNSIKDTGYEVANSCRFNSADSAELTRSISSTSNRRTGTLSAWVKLCDLSGTAQAIFANLSSGTNRFLISFESGSILKIGNRASGTYDLDYQTTRVFKDPSAWFHIVVRVDTTQASSGDRVKLWVNGVEETSFSSSVTPSQNSDTQFNLSGHNSEVGGDNKMNGYLAEVHWCDGYAYSASDFGEYDEDSPTIWKPKKADVSYGTNGFFVEFKDSSALGDDTSGNGNDFTASNLDATDQATDTPTNNFATLNPLATSSLNDLSQANVKVSGNSSSNDGETFSTFIMPNATAKWYWEIKCTNKDSTGNPKLGFIQASKGFQLRNGGAGYGGAASGDLDIMVRPDGKTLENGSTSGSAVISTWDTDDVLSFALDSVNGAFYVGINGTWQTSGNPESGASKTGAIKTWTTTDSKCDEGQAVCIGSYNTSVAEANFGSPSFSISSGNADGNGYGNFKYAVPSGYLSLCTKNLGSDGG